MKILAIMTLLYLISLPGAGADVDDSIVKVYSVENRPNYYEPWQMLGQRKGSGSGCIIKGKRILTNAHVINDSTFIQVRKKGKVKKFEAYVEFVAHDCDLAILKLKDESFFEGTKTLSFGALPHIKDKVHLYGYPMGGDKLSITEGVISRIEHHNYSHSRAYLFTFQIDAATNPGSSGGPVIKDNKIVGLAFQGSNMGQNINYVIPVTMIKRFAEDTKDNNYEGVPTLGIWKQDLENPDLRKHYMLPDSETGFVLREISPYSPLYGILHKDDVITSIDGYEIENDATIEFRPGERTSFAYVYQHKQIGEKIRIGIYSKGKFEYKDIMLKSPYFSHSLVYPKRFDIMPTYYIFGGLVFSVLSEDYLALWGNPSKAPLNLAFQHAFGKKRENKKELIFLSKVLSDDINVGYHDWRDHLIREVNGKKIRDIRDLMAALETNEAETHVIITEQDYKIVLSSKKVKEFGKHILENYKIPFDRSEDLRSN